MSQMTTMPARAALPTDSFYCSFCLKPAAEVQKLVAGQGRIFICDGCVAVCTDYVTRGASDRSSPIRIEETPTERLLEVLAPIKETVEGKSNQLQTAVDTLRGRSISWARIAGALGISRQAACERFSRNAGR